MRGDVLARCFCVERQHPELVGPIPDKIDDPKATSLAYAWTGPAYLANPARTRNHFASLGVLHQELLQVGVLIIVQVYGKQSLKNGRLDKCEHRRRIRLRRTKGKPQAIPISAHVRNGRFLVRLVRISASRDVVGFAGKFEPEKRLWVWCREPGFAILTILASASLLQAA